jgi:hypothetical protein
MKKKSNIVEMDAGTVGGEMGSTSTSTTTANKPTSSTSGKKHPTVHVKKADLKKTMDNLKGVEADVVVLEYLSEVKDTESGNISQPFTIGDKKYQMVRAVTPTKEKVMGVYSFNEVNEDGSNKIYNVEDFEKNIAQKAIMETGVVEPEGPEAVTLNPMQEKEKENPSFAGYKHFIVNSKTGKARKFKSIEELAKAQMGEGEKYMGIKEFKRFVDEALFGAGKKKSITELDDNVDNPELDEKMRVEAKKLMDLMVKKIPEGVFKKIKIPQARREVIAAFAELIGVPRNGLSQLISGLKDLAKGDASKPQPIEKGTEPTPASTQQPVAENRIIKTIKVKDIK